MQPLQILLILPGSLTVQSAIAERGSPDSMPRLRELAKSNDDKLIAPCINQAVGNESIADKFIDPETLNPFGCN
jgi:hypothetical protein